MSKVIEEGYPYGVEEWDYIIAHPAVIPEGDFWWLLRFKLLTLKRFFLDKVSYDLANYLKKSSPFQLRADQEEIDLVMVRGYKYRNIERVQEVLEKLDVEPGDEEWFGKINELGEKY